MDSDNTKQLALRIDTTLHQEFKKLCVDENKSMKDYIVELIQKELEQKKVG